MLQDRHWCPILTVKGERATDATSQFDLLYYFADGVFCIVSNVRMDPGLGAETRLVILAWIIRSTGGGAWKKSRGIRMKSKQPFTRLNEEHERPDTILIPVTVDQRTSALDASAVCGWTVMIVGLSLVVYQDIAIVIVILSFDNPMSETVIGG